MGAVFVEASAAEVLAAEVDRIAGARMRALWVVVWKEVRLERPWPGRQARQQYEHQVHHTLIDNDISITTLRMSNLDVPSNRTLSTPAL